MALETDKFIISDVEQKFAESRRISADRTRNLQPVGFNSLKAFCKGCMTSSPISEGHGLLPMIGGVIVTCPSCGKEEKFTGKQLLAAD